MVALRQLGPPSHTEQAGSDGPLVFRSIGFKSAVLSLSPPPPLTVGASGVEYF